MGLTCFKSWKHDSTRPKGGNRDVLASPGSYFFLSNSCGQGEEWLKSLNRGVWIPFTDVRDNKQPERQTGSSLSHSAYRRIKRALSFRHRVFGQRLEETVLYERRYGVHLVPLVVEQCVGFIRERGLQEVGLFRQPGQATLVKELQQAFDAGEKPSFDSGTDVHTVASLLKLYLRQLPEPLIPFSRYHDFLLCGKKLSSDRTQGLVELKGLLHDLPVANFNLLNYICEFLNEVQSYSSNNRMSRQNLATVFGPNILRAKAEDAHSIIGGAAVVQQLMSEMIKEHQSLFSRPPPSCSAQPPGGPNSSPNAARLPQLHPCSRQLSLPLITEGRGRGGSSSSPWDIFASAQPASEHPNTSHILSAAESSVGQRRPLGHRYTSSHPETCLHPLSSTSYPVPHPQPVPQLLSSTSHTAPHPQPVPQPKPRTDRYSAAQPDYQRHDGRGQFPAPLPAFSHATSATAQIPAFPLTDPTPSFQTEDPVPDSSRSVPRGCVEARTYLGEMGACLWNSGTEGPAEEEGTLPGTASRGSSEAQEDSTLSVYDNLDRDSLYQRMKEVTGSHFETTTEDNNLGTSSAVEEGDGARLQEAGRMVDSSSSWSSCEILPLDESSCQDDVVGGPSPTASPRRSSMTPSNQGSEDNSDDDEDDEDDKDDNHRSNSPASSSVPTDAPLSTGSSEVFLPSGPPDPQRPQTQGRAEDVHSLLVELRQQMARQQADYQDRIHRLEQCNEALQGQVVVLRASLEQQKHWHSVAEIKIRNVERARADADCRNATLQREMEQFFRMFGEIHRGKERKAERTVQTF